MKRQRIHRIIYIGLLAALVVALPTSVYVMNMVWVLLLINWVLEGQWKQKFADFRSNYLLQAYLAMTVVVIAGLCWSGNMSYGADYLRRFLPLLVVPLVVLTSSPLKPNHVRRIMVIYVGTVVIVSFIGLVRYLTIPDLPYRHIVPYISHIRFALNICLAICLLLGFAFEPAFNYYAKQAREGRLRNYHKPAEMLRDFPGAILLSTQRHFDWLSVLSMVLILWLLLFLLLIQSYTAYIILFVTGAVLLAVYWRRIYVNNIKWSLLLLWLLVAVAACVTVGSSVHSYYNMIPMAKAPLAQCTVNGRPYTHAQDGMVENGNYIYNYVCREELRTQWNKLGRQDVDSLTPNGYAIYGTLIRYLNNLGLTKDSVGVAQLTGKDIHAIEQGVANPVYLTRSFKRMVYVMLFERENYIHFHSVKGNTMSQRFELWKAGRQVFLQHPLFGTGTGDVVDALHSQLTVRHSELTDTDKHTHNQYLTFLMTFGIVGFSIIVFFFVRAFVREKMMMPPILLAYSCIVLISFLSEDTLETLAGALFACFFACLFVRQKKAGNTKL